MPPVRGADSARKKALVSERNRLLDPWMVLLAELLVPAARGRARRRGRRGRRGADGADADDTDELSTALGAYGKDLDAREWNVFTTTDEETAAIQAYWEAHTALTPDDQLPAVLVALSAHVAKRERSEQQQAAAPTVVPRAYVVEGGGFAPANGTYTRDGDYGGSPKWVHADGQIWLIRYRLPSGSHYWYVADKDQLSRDDGDYYRVKTEAALPPVDGDWRLAKDGVEPPPRFTADVPPTPAESSGNGPVAKLKALIEDQIRARKISAYELIRLASQKGHLFNDGTSARSGDAGMFAQGVGRATRRIRGGFGNGAEFDFGNGGFGNGGDGGGGFGFGDGGGGFNFGDGGGGFGFGDIPHSDDEEDDDDDDDEEEDEEEEEDDDNGEGEEAPMFNFGQPTNTFGQPAIPAFGSQPPGGFSFNQPPGFSFAPPTDVGDTQDGGEEGRGRSRQGGFSFSGPGATDTDGLIVTPGGVRFGTSSANAAGFTFGNSGGGGFSFAPAAATVASDTAPQAPTRQVSDLTAAAMVNNALPSDDSMLMTICE